MAIVKITNENFEQEVLAAKEPVLLDFWADWCMPCKMQSEVLDAFAEEMGDRLKIGKINVDEEAALALKYQVMSIPTLVVMDKGVFVKRESGLKNAEELKIFLEGIA